MPYQFEPGKMYRMPTHFGTSLGPRQGQNGRKFSNVNSPKKTIISVSFLTNRKQLAMLLPEGFEVSGDPVVSVELQYITEIGWLAGRGYNTLGVSFPAVFNGANDHVGGNFLLVLWENLADAIITGREELGFSKIYCDIPAPRILGDRVHCKAGWMGFNFMDMSVTDLKPLSPENLKTNSNPKREDGTLHYKYIPKTGDWGRADAAYPVLTPSFCPDRVVKEAWSGEGTVEFHPATWEDLPTMVTIVDAIRQLEIIAYRGAKIVKTVGGKDFSDQRILS